MLRVLDAEGALRRRRHGRQQVKGFIEPAMVAVLLESNYR